ncbi:hypothetical protein VNO78_24846 [Psophocarpus tetragonolobus]|uniref:Uncharacterized protein n=1 Tax=Psophocarpus tetragonolobus TaxID=3891 RepID=A0AAN9XFB8_PSOTE
MMMMMRWQCGMAMTLPRMDYPPFCFLHHWPLPNANNSISHPRVLPRRRIPWTGTILHQTMDFDEAVV